jgi:uncharacterized RDD family membrane protein YckC
MEPDDQRIGAIADLPRAGYWRRWLATLIDSIVVTLPFQVLAAILFAATAGMVQMDSGFYRNCAAATIPQSLDPPPPHDSNFATVCHTSFFGAPTDAFLTVGRTTQEGSTTITVSQGYRLDKEGKPIHGISIDWIAGLAFLAYLIGMVRSTGQTLGAEILNVRMVDVAAPDLPGVPIHRAIIRYLAMAIGFVPAVAVLLYQYAVTDGSADAMATGSFFQWLIFAFGLALLWIVVLIYQIAAKKDPFYDRIAGTAVLRDAGGEPTSSRG